MTTGSVPARVRVFPLLLAIACSAAACTDAVSDPMAGLMAQETRAALELGGDLPTLALLWVESGGRPEEAPVLRWEDSWELPTLEGRALRVDVYAETAPDLYTRLGTGELESLLVDMDSTLARIEQLSAVGIPERVSRRLDSAREMLTMASIHAEEGRGASSLVAALQASDYLLEVTPPHVAAQLLTSAEAGVRRISSDDSYSEEIVERAVRLVAGAREAIHVGDYARAIRASYYACLLMGVELPE